MMRKQAALLTYRTIEKQYKSKLMTARIAERLGERFGVNDAKRFDFGSGS